VVTQAAYDMATLGNISMSFGFWGSRFPIGNLASSKLIVCLMRRRLGWLRLRNRIVKRRVGKQVQVTNGPEREMALQAWRAKGYDKINLGGGNKNLEHFINVDFLSHPAVQREIVANILDLSFIPSGSLSQVHTNHVIEHLSEQDIVTQLGQYYRILKPGGVITIRCPNALGVTFGFWFPPVIEGERRRFIELGFPADEDFGNPDDAWFHKDFYGFLHWLFGDVGNVENQHLSIISPTKLTSWLRSGRFELLAISEPEAVNLVVVARKVT
jgi:SAM-dependent methyltransferase